MRSLVVVLLVVACAPARAGEAPKPLTPEQQKQLKDALARGRALAKKGDAQGALAAFKAAVAIGEHDAAALSELSLAALKANDLKLAEDAARRSVASSESAKVRAASLYNLGRVQEQRGEKQAAIDSYSRSLGDRPNKIVRERLATLDPQAAARLDTLAPQRMDGPFPSLENWCRKSGDREACLQDADASDAGEKPTWECAWKKPAATAQPGGEWSEARVFATACKDSSRELESAAYHLAVKRKDGWWIAVDFAQTLNTMRQTEELDVQPIEARDVVPGGAPELLVRFGHSSDYRGTDSIAKRALVVCGVGPSGGPSCTGGILVEETVERSDPDRMGEDGYEPVREGVELGLAWQPDGALDIAVKKKIGGGLAKDTLAPLVGRHVLAFP